MPAYSNEVKKIKGGTNVKSYGQMLYAKTRSKTTDANKKLYETVWKKLKDFKVEECMCARQIINVIREERSEAMKKTGMKPLNKEEKKFWQNIFDTIAGDLFW